MELIGLILVIIGIGFAGTIISAVLRTMGAVAKSAVGKGSFTENMDFAFKGMLPLELRLVDGHIGDDEDSPATKEIEGRGLFPLDKPTRIGFVTSVLDMSAEDPEPVISAIEVFQEPESIIYQSITEVGEVSPNQGLANWVRIGVVIPDILQPPYGGNRQLAAVLRMVDLDNEPTIRHGFGQSSDEGLLWTESIQFQFNFSEKGYQEAAEHRNEASAITLKIGVAVAMADGSLDDSEAQTLKDWVLRSIDSYSSAKKTDLKEMYNNAMRDAYAQSLDGELSLSGLTTRLNEIGEKKLKYDAIELCFDIMAADGVADAQEMKTISSVADALGLDINELEKLRDQKIVQLGSNVSGQATIEELLGIDATWDADSIKQHLMTEFQKWNNRINALEEGEERANAQKMLELIAEARSKYG